MKIGRNYPRLPYQDYLVQIDQTIPNIFLYIPPIFLRNNIGKKKIVEC